eukprot:Phypoly_transcript_21071.p1 GENE.Phypoly_transcript_21071~~Phypoly_transcript_21071.p1  ORF type:complete len:133 (-),score=22.06 Phypoly_transcript_21071:113-511(-)
MPPEYKEKMKNGQALTQEEREILFDIVYTTLDNMLSKGHVVGAMQLLKNVHREQMSKRYSPNFTLITLKAQPETLQTRLSSRSGHWFNPKVLEALVAANEEPSIPFIPVNAEQDKDAILEEVCVVVKEKLSW